MVFIVILDIIQFWGGPGSRSRIYVATISTQNVYLATISTQTGYVATIATPNEYAATLRDRRNFKRLFAAQTRYVATLRVPNKVCCDHCDSKSVCCDFVRRKYLRDFARPKTDMLRFCDSTLFGSIDPIRLMI